MNRINKPLNPNFYLDKINNKNKDLNVKNKKSFEEIFNKVKSNDIKFSKHAKERMTTRNIKLTEDQIIRLENAMDKAENKGIKEALILIDKKAFIASVENKTIITTANHSDMKEKIFTNIDGAIIT
ncbi:TIGR02530 family flagellar biosynthesis protein [Dethiothermospora halolimnae]|uniref:TIGR02530 family flagellar biosynthesis protein n=1 Tax=Dethiothermospora halolimnae TaxID=3114390 RepID=UPI003CCB74E7